jgi:carbamoyl-phosphate synthase small subunit
MHSAILALEDGSIFRGISIGADGLSVGEVVFNTSMTGYQEILTDPSYSKQIVTLTYPHIGNTGVNSEDEESAHVWCTGLVIRDLPLLASSWRKEESLENYLKARGVIAIADIDTRRLTRILREKGAQNGCIIAGIYIDQDASITAAIAAAKGFSGLKGMDLAKVVSTQESYSWNEGTWVTDGKTVGYTIQHEQSPFHVVAYDFGVKRNILRMLRASGCRLTVVPAQTPASEVLAMNPDGVFLSNGPGDPVPCDYAIQAAREIMEHNIPMFGICLGHQILSIASGAQCIKMKFGHHGANHPVEDLKTKQVMITSQNHGFAVDENTLPANLIATHRSLFDGSLQGVERIDKPVFSFQGHPEASPGPHDVALLFDHFIELMQTYQSSRSSHSAV